MLKYLLIFAVLAVATSQDAEAGPFRRGKQQSCTTCTATTTTAVTATNCGPNGCQLNVTRTVAETSIVTTGSALDEVNAKRAARGLRPLMEDPALTQAAASVASKRAALRVFGHIDDFNHLPAGATARAAGCAAYPPEYGWMSCCVYDSATYGGAAWVMGPDGKRYMHLFVR